MRLKDQDYNKKVALMQQKIELLELQLRDAEERETSQKKMYDRMFQALDDNSSNKSPNSARNRGDNETSKSIGSREIDILNRQFHE